MRVVAMIMGGMMLWLVTGCEDGPVGTSLIDPVMSDVVDRVMRTLI